MALAGWEDRLHAADASVFQHHLDAVRMGWAFREDTHSDALGLLTGGLVLLLDYTHPLTGAYLASVGYRHKRFVSSRPRRGLGFPNPEPLRLYTASIVERGFGAMPVYVSSHLTACIIWNTP